MNRKKHIEQFAKLAEYILGHRPDEFGLVPDENGYIKIKEFLQAVAETDGWRHIRKNYINEMLLVLNDPPIEVEETRIRSKNYSSLPEYVVCENPPKLLYSCIKQKSYQSVLENGIRPTAHPKIVCCKDPDMAKKIGSRRSPHPILLTIHTQNLLDQGSKLLHADEILYLTDFIPPECFSGPPISKAAPVAKKPAQSPDPIEVYKRQSQAGSFTLSIDKKDKSDEKLFKGKKKEKDKSWKNNKKRLRKEKKDFWPDQ